MRCFAYSFPSTFNIHKVLLLFSEKYKTSELGGEINSIADAVVARWIRCMEDETI